MLTFLDDLSIDDKIALVPMSGTSLVLTLFNMVAHLLATVMLVLLAKWQTHRRIEGSATEVNCRRVYQSMLMTEVLSFLPKSEATEMQLLNQFWYHKAVSRVLIRFKLKPRYLYFNRTEFLEKGKKLEIQIYNASLSEVTVKHLSLDWIWNWFIKDV